MDKLLQDLRYAVRALVERPGFALVAALTIALGVGGTTAMFSIVDATLLRPLPYADPGRLVMVWASSSAFPQSAASWPEFVDWREQGHSFADMAVWRGQSINLTGAGEPERLIGAFVSDRFFPILGARVQLGRGFTPEETDPASAKPVAVLSFGLWQRRFGADPAILGRSLVLNGQSHTVVGVLAPDFGPGRAPFDGWFMATEVFLPAPYFPNKKGLVRGEGEMLVIGRLRPGVTAEEAQADLSVVARRLEKAYPETHTGRGVQVVPMHEQIVGPLKPALLVLLGAMALVLLIACANVANLLLARGADRESELALRLALGASRARLVRQLLVESLLLSLLAGVAGLLIAWWSVTALVARVPADVPRLAHVGVDARVFAFSLGLCALTSLLIGLLPALRAAATHPADTLREGTRRASEALRGRRLRAAVVVGELALSLALLAGAGLTGRSLIRLLGLDPGFDPSQTLTARLSLPDTYATREDRTAFFGPLLERLGAIPGVEAAGLVLLRPLSDPIGWDYDFTVDGQTPEQQERNPPCNYEAVSADYFRAMRIPLVRGRVFGPGDGPEGAPVAIVSEALAERFWPGQEALGRRLKFGPADGDAPWHSVVGVVGDVRNRGWTDMWLDAYVPYQRWSFGRMDLVLRTSVDPHSVVPAFRRAVYAGDPELPLADVTTMDAAVREATAGPRFTALLLGLFAGVAVLLAAVGLYAVMAGTVARRTRELGVRMALGAGRGALLRLVVVDAFRLTAGGIAIGLCLALAGGRALHGLLYGVRPSDPSTLAAMALLLAAVALLASALPARRATRVDPMSALRYE